MMKKYTFTLLFYLLTFISYSQVIVNQNSTSTVVCDGEAYISDSLLVDPSVIYWDKLIGQTYIEVQSGGYTASNLCPGIYRIFYYYLNSQPHMDTITILDLNPCIGTIFDFSSMDASDSNLCNGEININVSTPYPPLTYSWSNSETTSVIDSLCVGNYSVTITNSVGCTYQDSCVISVQSIDSIIINNGECSTPWGGATVSIEDCSINFETIGLVTQNMTNNFCDSVETQVNIFDTNGVLMASYNPTYIFDNIYDVFSCWNSELIIHCDTFQTLVINSYILSDWNSIEEIDSHFNITNPITDILLINFQQSQSGNIEIYKLNGELILKKEFNSIENFSIDSSSLESGSYFLKIHIDNRISVRKIIKT